MPQRCLLPAGIAALAGAGAGATVASLVRRRHAPAPPSRGSDAAFVALIESVAAATSEARSIDEAMLLCLERLCRWTGWPVGHVYVAAADGRRLEPTELWFMADPHRFATFREATERMPLPAGVGLPGRVLETGLPAWIVDVNEDPNFPRRDASAAVGLRGAFSFAIPARDACFAVVECFSERAVRADERLLEVAAHIGRQLGRVVANMQMEQALRESETRFRSVAESANDAIVAADTDGAIISWNRGAELMFGYTGDEVFGRPLSILMPERFRALHDAGLGRVARHGPSASRVIGSTAEVVGLRKDGSEFPLELSLATWEASGSRFFSGIIRDISERKKAEERLLKVETAPDPIVEVGCDGRIILVNGRTDELFGYDRAEILGRPVEALFSERTRPLVAERVRTALDGAGDGRPVSMGLELWAERQDGSEFPVDVTLSAVRGEDGVVVTSIIRDITERKRFERQLQYLAEHDALTGLYNRRRFEQELGEFIASGGHGALLMLDLDRFKYINDTRGHKVGDEVVCAVGAALSATVRKTDVVARLGGDEFAVLLRDVDSAGAEAVAGELLRTVRERRLVVGANVISTTTSIGLALFGADDTDVEALLVATDVAMYAAKEEGGNRIRVSSGAAERVSGMQARLGWADEIRRALDEDRFVLYCQPILELVSDRVTQYELLLRMIGEDGEVVPPAAFMETAERFGLIQEVDKWVVKQAIALLAAQAGGASTRFEVNLSGRSIGDPSLPDLVERELRATGVDPGALVFEITETAAIENMEQARAFAERLRRLGCRFALDDFGAGFSSFYYLKYLPLDYVKIDGDFIRSLTSSVDDQLLVKAIVDIARGMGMKTIAEFVEGAETVAMLREKGVDYSQGFYHGAPRPVAEVLSPPVVGARLPGGDTE